MFINFSMKIWVTKMLVCTFKSSERMDIYNKCIYNNLCCVLKIFQSCIKNKLFLFSFLKKGKPRLYDEIPDTWYNYHYIPWICFHVSLVVNNGHLWMNRIYCQCMLSKYCLLLYPGLSVPAVVVSPGFHNIHIQTKIPPMY